MAVLLVLFKTEWLLGEIDCCGMQEELARVTRQLNNMNDDTDMMRKGIEGMDSSSVMIERTSQTTQLELEQVQ